MQLPGGLWHQGHRYRSFAFRPLTGKLELAISEAMASFSTLPEVVTAALAASLETIGPLPVTPALAEELSVGDRQFLARRLAGILGHDEVWLSAPCSRCGARFDFNLDLRQLPVKEAGATYPFAEVSTSWGIGRWRVPTGHDQKILGGASGIDGVRLLVHHCLVDMTPRPDSSPNGRPAFSNEELAKIEAAVEEVAPEVTTSVQVTCPDCHYAGTVEVDPYLGFAFGSDELTQDIHLLASTYHWSEAEILALPKARRKRYLQLIDQSRGMGD